MSQEVYRKQDLINLINHLQAKVNFYKQHFDAFQHQKGSMEDMQTKLKVEINEKRMLQEKNATLKREIEQLNEEIKRLQNSESERESATDSVFIKQQLAKKKAGKQTKQLRSDAHNLDPWFVRNLQERK